MALCSVSMLHSQRSVSAEFITKNKQSEVGLERMPLGGYSVKHYLHAQ